MKMLKVKKADAVGDTPRLIREMDELNFELYRWTRTLDAQANLAKYMDDEQKKTILFNLEHLDKQIKKFLEAEKNLMSSLK